MKILKRTARKKPKSLSEIVEVLLKHREELYQRYGVKHLKIFGSFARNEQKRDSDLDVIVSLDGRIDLLGFVELKHYLEEITGLSVDLVTDRGISPFVKSYIQEFEVF